MQVHLKNWWNNLFFMASKLIIKWTNITYSTPHQITYMFSFSIIIIKSHRNNPLGYRLQPLRIQDDITFSRKKKRNQVKLQYMHSQEKTSKSSTLIISKTYSDLWGYQYVDYQASYMQLTMAIRRYPIIFFSNLFPMYLTTLCYYVEHKFHPSYLASFIRYQKI